MLHIVAAGSAASGNRTGFFDKDTTMSQHASLRIVSFAALFSLCLFVSVTSAAQEGITSSMELMQAVSSIDGIRIVKVEDEPSIRYTEDYSPSQVLEIIRPDMRPITVGRLATSCSCMKATMSKRTFEQGERALIEVRNVKATPAQGAIYAIFAQLSSPYRTALQFDMFVKSIGPNSGHPEAPEVVEGPVVVPAPSAPYQDELSRGHQVVALPPPGVKGVIKAPGPMLKYDEIAPYAPISPAEKQAGE